MSIVQGFPDEWRTDVTVIRSGGRDSHGDPLPAQEIHLEDCLVGQWAGGVSGNASNVTSTDITLFRDPDPGFRFQSTDQIRIPEGARMAGLWNVVGRPVETPLGDEVRIKEG